MHWRERFSEAKQGLKPAELLLLGGILLLHSRVAAGGKCEIAEFDKG